MNSVMLHKILQPQTLKVTSRLQSSCLTAQLITAQINYSLQLQWNIQHIFCNISEASYDSTQRFLTVKDERPERHRALEKSQERENDGAPAM